MAAAGGASRTAGVRGGVARAAACAGFRVREEGLFAAGGLVAAAAARVLAGLVVAALAGLAFSARTLPGLNAGTADPAVPPALVLPKLHSSTLPGRGS